MSFSLTVVTSKDTVPPEVSVVADKVSIKQGENVNFTIVARDNVEVKRVILTINGKQVEIDSEGKSSYVFDSIGIYTVVVTAEDIAGNISTDTVEIKVASINDVKAPTVSISGPASNATINKAVDVKGTIADVDSPEVDWVVTLTDLDKNVWVVASGTGKFNNEKICELNPSNFTNGTYTLTVVAEDPAGHRTSASRQIKILSEYKVGNFEIPFEDLKIDLGGMPINIVRRYNADNAKYKGDFGYGWDLEYIPVKLETNLKVDPRSSLYDSMDPSCGFYVGMKIMVTLPDGSPATFTARAVTSWYTSSIAFDCDKPGYTLSLPGSTGLSMEGSMFTISGFPYNPLSPWVSVRNADWTLTTPEGMSYTINSATGLATQARNPNGDRITIGRDGFVSYNNANEIIGEVKFERDGQGRIVKITDPEGHHIDYEYDANGDLYAMTNREGERVIYGYVSEENAPKHHLETITDSRGVTILRVLYDFVSGRIAGIVDAAGNPISIAYTVQIGDGLTAEVVTDAMGNVTETVYDVSGNPVRVIQHIPDPNEPNNPSLKKYAITIKDFTSSGKMTGEAMMFTVSENYLTGMGTTAYFYTPQDLVWLSRITYDSRGNVASRFDAHGNETKHTYDSRGNLLTTTDAFGNVTTNVYNSKNLVTKTTDPAGVVCNYFYNNRGYLLYVEQVMPNGTKTRLSDVTYDSSGRMKTVVDESGNITEYTYDKNGRKTEEKITIIDPENPALKHVNVTHSQYDKEGRILVTWEVLDGQEVERTSYEYNGVGQLISSTNIHGLRTEYTLDILGRTIETKEQKINENGEIVWMVKWSVYDKNERIVWQSALTVDDNSGNSRPSEATHTLYDSLGRVIRTEKRQDVLFTVSHSDGIATISVNASGELVSFTAQDYDDAGRVWWMQNEAGVKTVNVYTREGLVDYVITDLDGNLLTLDDQSASKRNIYDSHGRHTGTLLDRDGDFTSTSDQAVTQFEYDKLGRVIKTVYADGTSTSSTYDELGRKTSETDQLGNTTYFEYDEKGRLVAVVLPKVKHPSTDQMVHVRYEYDYDRNGNQIGLRDNIFQLNASDPSSIVKDDARETTFTFNWQNKQTSRILPDGSTEYFHYNNKGQLVRHISFEGRVTVYEYDSYDRQTTVKYYASETKWNHGSGSPDKSVSKTYDANGRVIDEQDSAAGATRTEYNSSGQPTRIYSLQGVINYEYDSAGRVIRTWTGEDAGNPITDVRNSYDSLGRLVSVVTIAREGASLASPETTKYIYDLIGNLDYVINSNGVVADYSYDELNRLKELTHYKPDSTPEDPTDNTQILHRYSYDYHANGNKSGETFIDAQGNRHTWQWLYDTLGRFVREIHDNANVTLDYDTMYVYDLVGNRLEKSTDKNGDGIIDEQTRSVFDTNDRLLNETKILASNESERTEYHYNKTEQIAKVVTDLINNQITTRATMEYNVNGRLAELKIETYVNGSLTKVVIQQYEYNSNGIKVRQIERIDSNGDAVVDSTKTTEYHNDNQNHTGYSQVLEERVSENGVSTKTTTYTIGLDLISQFDQQNGNLVFLTDGHGSTRAVSDSNAQILQQYNYDAYGNALGFDAAEALTKYLYSGEQFNPVSGLQYLRARWYNPQTGTFNRLDPFSGDKQNPLSFHKYAYAHMNPVMGTDPSGNFLSIMMTIATITSASTAALRFYNNVYQLGYNVRLARWVQDHADVHPIFALRVRNLILMSTITMMGNIIAQTGLDVVSQLFSFATIRLGSIAKDSFGSAWQTVERTVVASMGVNLITGISSTLLDEWSRNGNAEQELRSYLERKLLFPGPVDLILSASDLGIVIGNIMDIANRYGRIDTAHPGEILMDLLQRFDIPNDLARQWAIECGMI